MSISVRYTRLHSVYVSHENQWNEVVSLFLMLSYDRHTESSPV